MNRLKLSKNVFSQIRDTIGMHPPECGGVLGAREGEIVTEFYFDEYGTGSADRYVPNVQMINDMLIHEWMPRGILMVGIVHSHSNGNEVPSCGDISYGMRILQALDTVDRFYLPIVTIQEGNVRMNGYVVEQDESKSFVCRRVECEYI